MRWALLIALIVGGVMFWKGKKIRAELSMMGEGFTRLHPDVQEKAAEVLRRAWLAGLPVGIFEGYRTEERQRELMGKGTSWVGDANNSYHRWGLAVDFVFLDAAGRWTWEPDGGREAWGKLGAIIEQAGFEWGGRWRNFDGPHAQLKVMNLAQLKGEYGTPEAVTWV